MKLGEKMQTLRKENMMSQEKLAEKLNVSRQAISKWEAGLAIPDTDNIARLSKFFQVPMEYLLFDEYESVRRDGEISVREEKTKRNKGLVLTVVGVLFLVLAIFLSYIMKYFEMQTQGSCYTNALNYLQELPLVLILIVGIICMAIGAYKTIKNSGLVERRG